MIFIFDIIYNALNSKYEPSEELINKTKNKMHMEIKKNTNTKS